MEMENKNEKCVESLWSNKLNLFFFPFYLFFPIPFQQEFSMGIVAERVAFVAEDKLPPK